MNILPTLRQLGHLVALADHRHFGRAATACALTQSSLSASIRELESLLRATLVDRSTRRVALTPLGQEMVERARRVLAEAEDLVSAAGAAREPLSGVVRMGVIPTIGPFLLPRVLPALRAAWPRLKLYLTEDLSHRLVEQLHDGRQDALLLATPYDCGAAEVEILFGDRFQVVAPRGHPLVRAPGPVAPERIAGEELLLLRDGHCLRDHALSACGMGGPRHQAAFEATSLYTLAQMVDNGLGVTLLPRMALDAGILKGTGLIARDIAGDAPVRGIALAWRKGTGRRDEFRLLARELRVQAPFRAVSGRSRPRRPPSA